MSRQGNVCVLMYYRDDIINNNVVSDKEGSITIISQNYFHISRSVTDDHSRYPISKEKDENFYVLNLTE